VALQFQQYTEQGDGKKKGPVRADVVSTDRVQRALQFKLIELN